jgi:hypothetical protein
VAIGAINAGQVVRNILSFTTTESAGSHTLEILITRPFTNLSTPNQYITNIDIAAVPLPAALPLFATGIGGLGMLGWRRKRRAQAVA